MKKLLLLILTVISIDVSAQTVEWVKTLGGSGDDEGHKCAVDASGNFLFTGTFSETMDWGDANIVSTGNRDMFLIKTDKNGNVLWGKMAGGDYNQSTLGKAVATDANNNVYVGGTFTDTLNIETQQFIAENDLDETLSDCFIAKYSDQGSLLWVKIFSGAAGDVIEEMNILNDQLVIVGSYKKSFSILGTTFTSDDPNVQSNYNPFIASLNLDGELNWVSKVNCTNGTCRAFDIDSEGNINLLLEAKGSIVFKSVGSGTQYPLKQSNAMQDNYIVKLKGTDGSLLWGNRLGSASYIMGYAVETDASNNIYCGGLFQGELKLESLDGNYQKVNAVNKFDYYVCKYSKDGNLLFVDAQGGNSIEGALDMIVNSNGSLYVAAYFLKPETIFHGETFSCEDGNEALLIKYDNTGENSWVKQTSTTKNSGYIYSMEMVSEDSLILLGHFKGDGTFFDGETYSTPDTLKDVWFALMADPETAPTGINDLDDKNSDILIYPVPANNYLYVKSQEYSDPIQSVDVFNIIGEKVYSSQNGVTEIEIGQIPSGVYFIQVKSKYKQKTKQIIIQH
ncbi:MAG: T9SS type A sorting domain-containing protein [Bacteroidales bacterium]|nr:T9SS type A sorting domain-containing protein [Bacteroidales bacterium]